MGTCVTMARRSRGRRQTLAAGGRPPTTWLLPQQLLRDMIRAGAGSAGAGAEDVFDRTVSQPRSYYGLHGCGTYSRTPQPFRQWVAPSCSSVSVDLVSDCWNLLPSPRLCPLRTIARSESGSQAPWTPVILYVSPSPPKTAQACCVTRTRTILVRAPRVEGSFFLGARN